jgi:hypothetical protein
VISRPASGGRSRSATGVGRVEWGRELGDRRRATPWVMPDLSQVRLTLFRTVTDPTAWCLSDIPRSKAESSKDGPSS